MIFKMRFAALGGERAKVFDQFGTRREPQRFQGFGGVSFGEQLLDLRSATIRDHGYQRVRPAQRGRARLALENYGFSWRNSTQWQETDLEPGEPPKYG